MLVIWHLISLGFFVLHSARALYIQAFVAKADSGRLRTTPDYSGRLQTTPDNTERTYLKLSESDRSRLGILANFTLYYHELDHTLLRGPS